MPLTGIQIFKLLPKTNCGECGVPTCLAFAMSLASGKMEMTLCPYLSEEAKASLLAALAPPIRLVSIGIGDKAIKIGGETVLFRHEKRFENQPGLAITISDMMAETEINARLERFKTHYERVGLTLRPELIAVKEERGDKAKFVALVNKVKQESDASIVLMSEKPEMLAAGLDACADRKPLLCAATKENVEAVAALAKEKACPVVAHAPSLDEMSQLTTRLGELGIKDIVMDSGAKTPRRAFEDQVWIRNLALNKKVRTLGFPTIVFPGEMTADPMKEAVLASVFIAKYAGIVVLSDFQGHSLFPLLVARMNIFTDPQRPLATTPGIYEVGKPDENSPVLITTNFSLTYFLISGEIENSRVPAYLLIMDTDGLSVLTAWAAGKFGADGIAAFIKKSGIESKVKQHKLIIPGYIASESGGLEEQLPGWEVLVGPREGAHIPAYLKQSRAQVDR